MADTILCKVDRGIPLSRQDAVDLLNIKNNTNDFYQLIAKANELSRINYNNKAYIFAQIGINAAPCRGNCKFCSLAKDRFTIDTQFEKNKSQVVAEAKEILKENIEALFLMTTADFDQSKFLAIGKAVKEILPDRINLIANIGDFDVSFALELKAAGFSGAYHIVRLRESIDTDIPKQMRLTTLNAIQNAGMDLYYCIEPIGAEHTYEEIADEMIRAREYNVDVMAVMGRVGVAGTVFEHSADLTEAELTKIAAVTRLVTNPKKSMNIHEPKHMPLLAGVNQLYAEFGINPRDNHPDTENSRGSSIETVKKMLLDAEYSL